MYVYMKAQATFRELPIITYKYFIALPFILALPLQITVLATLIPTGNKPNTCTAAYPSPIVSDHPHGKCKS